MCTKIRQVMKKVLGEAGTRFIRQSRAKFYELIDCFAIRTFAIILHVSGRYTTRLTKGVVQGRESQTCTKISVGSGDDPASLKRSQQIAPKPHVLFVTEKWCDCNPERGLTNSEHNLFGSLEMSKLATYNRFHFDEYYHEHKHAGDAALLKLCMNTHPDLAIMTWYAGSTRQTQYLNPRIETLNLIHSQLHVPIVAIWWDSVLPAALDLAEMVLPFVEANVVVDSSAPYQKRTHHPEKYLHTWVPQDPRIYFNPQVDRDIDISFAGGLENYPDRNAGITALRSNGVEVYQVGGQRERRLSTAEYARIHMRSKIALNFCRTARGGHVQCKGRVWEVVLCGAMLLESDNQETAKWLEPMVDYVPFSNEKDLVDKAKHYLAHPSERNAIAERGHCKARERYSGEMFWRTVFDKVWPTAGYLPDSVCHRSGSPAK